MDLIDGSGLWLGASTIADTGAVAVGALVQGRDYEQALEYWENYGRPQGNNFEWQYPVRENANIVIDEIELDDEEILLVL